MKNTECRPLAKRLLSVLFAITLVTGLVPLSAYAAAGDAVGDKAEAATTGQEQGTQGTDDQAKATENEGTDSDSGDSDKAASDNETSADETATDPAISSESNGLSSNANDANAINLLDNSRAVPAADNSLPYNFTDGIKQSEIFSYVKNRYGSLISKGIRYVKLDNKTKITNSDTSFFVPEKDEYSAYAAYIDWDRTYINVGKVYFEGYTRTAFESNNDNGGVDETSVTGATFESDGYRSDADKEVSFKVKSVQDATGSNYDVTVKNGNAVIEPNSDGVYKFTTTKENSTISITYTQPAATLTAYFSNASLKVGKQSVENGTPVYPKAEETHEAVVTPGDGYAVTSVKLSGGTGEYAYSDIDLLEGGTFENCAAKISIPKLGKDMSYELKIETAECKLALKENPSAAVKGLTDKDKVKQRVIDGVLDLKNSVPSNISADDLTIEYKAGLTDRSWEALDYEPESYEVTFHKFGAQDNETIRITYNGNAQYCKLETGSFSINIIDGRTPTYIEANESVSVKYAPEADLKKAIEAAIAPKVYDEGGNQIADPQVEFDYSNFNRAVGTQCVTVKYPGSEMYKNSELTVEVQIAKGDAKVSVDSQSITYGGSFNQPIVSASPTEAKPVYAIVGIEGDGSSYVSIDFGSITVNDALGGNIPDYVPAEWREKPLQDVITYVLGNEFSANDLLNGLDRIGEYLEYLNKIPGVNVDVDGLISRIRAVLDKVSEIAPGVMDSNIVLGGTPDQAGVYAVAAVTVNPNYANDVAVGYLTIAPATQNVELKFKYELPGSSLSIDEAKSFDFSAGLYQGSLDITSKGNVSCRFIGTDYDGNAYASTAAPTSPGVYTQVVSNIGGNYYASPIHREFRIARVDTELSISFEGATSTGDNKQSVVYTGSQVQPKFKVTAGDVELDSSTVQAWYVDLSQGYSKSEPPTNVGTYKVYAGYPGTSYYAQSIASCELTIERQSINPEDDTYRDVDIEGVDDVVYDGTEHVWNPVVKDAAGNELVQKTDYVVAYSTADFTNVGEIKVTITGIGNYTGEVVKTYKIVQQSINPEDVDNYLDVKIDDPENTVYNGEEQKWSPEVNHEDGSELVMGNDYAVTYMRGNQVTEDLTSAGEITVVIEGQGNYTGKVEKSYTIAKRDVQFTGKSDAKVYNGSEQSIEGYLTNTEPGEDRGLVDGHTANVEAKASGTDVGTAGGTITDAEDVVIMDAQGSDVTANYSIKTEPGTMTITAQSIDPDEEAYLGVEIQAPEDVVYNGKEQKLAPVVADKDGNLLKEGADYELSYSTEDFTNAGEVAVTVAGKGNYTGEVECVYTIEKAAIKVADSATKVYNGAEQMFYVQATDATGLVQGEVLTLSDAQVKGTEPGVYTEVSPYTWKVVKADKTDSTGNYTIEVSGTLTITAADSAAADTGNGNSDKAAKADKGTAPQTGDTTAPFAVGAAFAAAAALVALFVSRKLRRSGTR